MVNVVEADMDVATSPPFFWLHIKKSAGSTARSMLQPYYKNVDRGNKPCTFIQAKKSDYNDILNNYRIPLGDYQFKRALFARDFLYDHNWYDIYSFAFCRNPVERCLSAFYYLYFKNGLQSFLNRVFQSQKLVFSIGSNFDLFLAFIEEAQVSKSSYKPISLHFTTHTAPMWGDVTDEEGNILLTSIFRLEDLEVGIKHVYQQLGLPFGKIKVQKRNVNKRKDHFYPNKEQIRKIERIYSKDFDLYEKFFTRL